MGDEVGGEISDEVIGEATGEAKRAFRRPLLAARRALPAAGRERRAVALRDVLLGTPEVRAARTVTAYVAVGGEPGTQPLLDALHAAGTTVLLPLTRPDMTLDWAAYDGPGSLVAGAYGLREPSGHRLGDDAVLGADAVLLPALAVGRDGLRLGRGGGCYDRVLAALAGSGSGTWTCALVYASERRDTVPAEPHDRRVAAAATEVAVTRFPPLASEPTCGEPTD